MTPGDPQFHETWPPVAEEVQPLPPPRPEPFWSYYDLALVLGLLVPAFLAAAILTRLLGPVLPFGRPFRLLAGQLILYVLVLGSMLAVFRLRYDAPFWRSLAWKFPFRGFAVTLFAGPMLAITLGYAGYVMRAPEIESPFREMLNNRPTAILFFLLVVMFGPLFEELTFRGFLMPLFMRSLGVTAGILVTAILFGAMHAPEYQWSWRHALLVSMAAVVFGMIRHVTGSTAASTLLHATFNLTQFAALLAQTKPQW